ncbi:TPA: molybdopterin-guanine dinucleotide biosynthesis protein MobC [Salmonella enterica]|nr:molybdopterin-guanine dinucleotide biosynthesis protein MobC [Salmonella enterica subsp. enterica serovar Hvittingfoss]HCL5312586.1 molybdopterin-guanine dinucleotide biosynthesis protein MobC [Salmonella enterica]
MSENFKKDRVVSFRLSENEFAPFEEKLAASEMKKSEFFREIFLNSNVNLTVKGAPSKEYKNLVFIFNKASNNLNQVAYKANVAHMTGHISENLYRRILNQLVNIRELLQSGVNNVD